MKNDHPEPYKLSWVKFKSSWVTNWLCRQCIKFLFHNIQWLLMFTLDNNKLNHNTPFLAARFAFLLSIFPFYSLMVERNNINNFHTHTRGFTNICSSSCSCFTSFFSYASFCVYYLLSLIKWQRTCKKKQLLPWWLFNSYERKFEIFFTDFYFVIFTFIRVKGRKSDKKEAKILRVFIKNFDLGGKNFFDEEILAGNFGWNY